MILFRWLADSGMEPDLSSSGNNLDIFSLHFRHQEEKPAELFLTISLEKAYALLGEIDQEKTGEHSVEGGQAMREEDFTGLPEADRGKLEAWPSFMHQNVLQKKPLWADLIFLPEAEAPFSSSEKPKDGAFGHVPLHLFRGILQPTIYPVDKDFAQILLISCAPEAHIPGPSWRKLEEKIKKKDFSWYHPQMCEQEYLEEILASRPLMPYWHRCGGDLGLSHAIRGGKNHQVFTESVLLDDLFRLKNRGKKLIGVNIQDIERQEPLKEVQVDVSAQWVQTLWGCRDFSSTIAAAFSDRVIETYTPNALMKSWPWAGKSLGHPHSATGYRILKSHLLPLDRELDLDSVPTAETLKKDHCFVIDGPLQEGGRPVRWMARKVAFQGALHIMYTYQQKHSEVLSFSLKAPCRTQSQSYRQEKLKWALPKLVHHEDLPFWQPFCFFQKDAQVQHEGKVYQALKEGETSQFFNPGDWMVDQKRSLSLMMSNACTFFGTSFGQEVFSYALSCAQTALIWGARSTFIALEGDFQDLAAIGLDDEVTVFDHRFLEKGITGKVKEIEWLIDPYRKKRSAKIKLACLAFMDEIPAHTLDHPRLEKEALEDALNYMMPGYLTERGMSDYLTSSSWLITQGVLHKNWDGQTELKEDPVPFRGDIPFKVSVENDAKAQEKYLETLQEKVSRGMPLVSSDLLGKETKIALFLPPLKTSENLEKSIEVDIPLPWFPQENDPLMQLWQEEEAQDGTKE